jgi:hypothetical protein
VMFALPWSWWLDRFVPVASSTVANVAEMIGCALINVVILVTMKHWLGRFR